MSIQLELTVYGPELARALGNDAEELAYFLQTLSENHSATDLGNEVAGYGQDQANVAEWLEELARAVRAEA